MVKSCHKCYIFEGRQKLQPLPLKPIEVSAPFSNGGWISLVKFIPLLSVSIDGSSQQQIISQNGSRQFPPDKLWMRMVEFCHKYHIILGHSTSYHPQGNGLAESSNKSLVNIINKLLEINKKSWHKRLLIALWVDWVIEKKSIGTSPFELVYGVDTVFPTSLAALVVKLLQEASSEDDPMQRRLNEMVHLQ
eukprot:PITA_33924